MTFSGGFLVAPPHTRPSIDTLIFVVLKVFIWYMSGPSFIYVWLVVLQFWNFKCFQQQKVQFQAASGRFFGRNPLKCGQICLKFWSVMQCNITHQAYDGFYFILKKHLHFSQKTDFLDHFERFLVYTFLRPMSYTPIFCQI